MRKSILASIAVVGLLVLTSTAVQAASTGYAVAINTPLTNNLTLENPHKQPIIVIARCNATLGMKSIEAWVDQFTAANVQDMVASTNDTGRLTITFVVPWGWHYYINTAPTVYGETCVASAWWTT